MRIAFPMLNDGFYAIREHPTCEMYIRLFGMEAEILITEKVDR